MMNEQTPAIVPLSRWCVLRQRAQGMLEYAILVALVALGMVAKATDLGSRIGALWDALGTAISGVKVP